MIRLLLTLLLLAALPATAQESVVAGLSQNRVAITATFVGSEILIFGAIKRDTPVPEAGDLNVIIVVSGPSQPLSVRRKSKRYGIWVNGAGTEIEAAPSFYAVATSAPLSQAITKAEDLRHHISIPNAVVLEEHSAEAMEFAEAVIRIREDQGLYKLEEGAVNLQEETLFETSVSLPANLTEGEYHARIYLTRGGEVVSDFDTMINVQKVGIERWMYNLAHEKPLIYGLLSLIIAIAAGWGASTFFRVVLRS